MVQLKRKSITPLKTENDIHFKTIFLAKTTLILKRRK